MNRDLLVICVIGLVLLGGTLIAEAFPQKHSMDQAIETAALNEERTVNPVVLEKKADQIKSDVDSDRETKNGDRSEVKTEPEVKVESSKERDRDNGIDSNIETISAAEITYIDPASHHDNSDGEQTDQRKAGDPKERVEQKTAHNHEKHLKQSAE